MEGGSLEKKEKGRRKEGERKEIAKRRRKEEVLATLNFSKEFGAQSPKKSMAGSMETRHVFLKGSAM